MNFILKPGKLSLEDLRLLLDDKTTIELDAASHPAILASEKVIADIIKQGKVVYGVNTGFGALANKIIKEADLKKLQRSIVSHMLQVSVNY